MDYRRLAADIIGYIIAASLLFLWYPQIKKICKHKHTHGLSIKTIIINIWISSLGTIYAILISETPLLVGRISLLAVSILLFILHRYYISNTKNVTCVINNPSDITYV